MKQLIDDIIEKEADLKYALESSMALSHTHLS